MKRIEAYGSTTNGVHRISYRDEFMQQWNELGDCKFRITIEKLYKKRSLEQNSYYWHVVLHEFVKGYKETTGEQITREMAHDILKGRFNVKEVMLGGSPVLVPQSTTELSTAEYGEYIEKCRDFVAEFFGIDIPAPGEQSEMEFKG